MAMPRKVQDRFMRNLFDAMYRHADEAGDRVAVSDSKGIIRRGELLANVIGLAADLGPQAGPIGILAPNGIDWVIAQLGCALAGKIVVPLPTFFSSAQLGHIVRTASVGLILTTNEAKPLTQQSGVATRLVGDHVALTDRRDPVDGFGQIIYTSGSTGQPKGVRHESGQIAWSAAALANATGAAAEDTYLSVLPLPLLLETICSIFIPAMLGAYVHFDTALAEQVGLGDAKGISRAFELKQPTTSVVVPQLLKQWVGELQAVGSRAPASLRFVAVGGAPVPRRVADKAGELGIPVHEGYGLSECCSVVALNRPGERRAGTVGRPLDGLKVSIDDGEIVVDGPSITDGYLGQGPAQRPWRTGDLGVIDQDGLLTIHGRKDSLIVTSFGRNISPEWIETMLLGDLRIAFCAVVGHGAPSLTAVIIPSRPGESWFANASYADVLGLVSKCCAGAPEYAVPRTCVVASLQEAISNQLLTNGRPARKQIKKFVATKTPPAPAAAISKVQGI
jgi:long-subunit acyl-CoA synthetase (AMP-forming)